MAINETTSDTPIGQPWEVALYAVIGVIGVLTNGFTFVVIMSSKDMREKTTNKMILNQTVIDWVACWLFVANAITVGYSSKNFGKLYCHLWVTNYFMWSALNALSFNLMALTLERYFAVLKPVFYRKFTPAKAKFTMVAVWVGGLAVTAPHIFAAEYVKHGDGSGDGNCTSYPVDPPVFFRINAVFNYLAVFIAPVALMVFCYSQMILYFKRKQPAHKEEAESPGNRRSARLRKVQWNIFVTFIVVSTAFSACWFLSQTLLVLYNLGVRTFKLDGVLVKVSCFITYSNCLMNPFIYTFQYYDFQVALKRLLFRKNEASEENTAERSDSMAISDSQRNL